MMVRQYAHGDVEKLPIGSIRPPLKNPNAMSPARYALLVKAMRKIGMVQPVLVKPLEDGTFIIVDGAHRLRAALEIGLEFLWCVISLKDDDESALIQIGMNHLRGELDLHAVSVTLADMVTEGFAIPELTLSGFDEAEINELIDMARQVDPLAGGIGLPDTPPGDSDPGEDGNDKPFVIELTFATKAMRDKVKKALRKAAGGKGKPLEAGILALIDGS